MNTAKMPLIGENEPNGRLAGLEIPVEGNVFNNNETVKYMRIIDTYKKLGVGKDIELPRVCNHPISLII